MMRKLILNLKPANFLIAALFIVSLALLFRGISMPKSGLGWRSTIILISAISTVFTACLFYVKEEIKFGVLLVFFSSGLSLFLFNFALEIRPEPYIKNIAPPPDKAELILNMRNIENITAYPRISPLVYREYYENKLATPVPFLPLSAISNSVILNGPLENPETPGWMIIKSDRYGFNNPDHVYEKPGNKILIVGDSFAAGVPVPEGKDVAGVLRTRGHNAISLGYSGNGPLSELATVLEYGPYLKPDIIFWFWFDGNDVGDLILESQNPILLKYLKGDEFSQNLIQRQKEINEMGKKISEYELNKYLANKKSYKEINSPHKGSWKFGDLIVSKHNLITLYHIRNLMGFSADTLAMKNFQPILEKAKKTSNNLGAELYFVYIPTIPYIERGAPAPTYKEVLSGLQKLNIEVLDLYSIFNSMNNPLDLYDGHLNEEGYEFLANLLEKQFIHQPPH
ncbi:MAG: hypothetical protein HOJ79_02770 [Nitrospina sp.]|jgi:hypothetical protein|nr:hypothetical protein [Nitrospina sp.]